HWKVGLYLSGIPPCHRCSHEDSFFVTGVVNDDYWASDSLGRIYTPRARQANAAPDSTVET
ncbi:hypothetical protein MXL91_20160, partial [Achromobacter ruhlandii]|uniref:hypothetical protein n=1 Tax=Achromobacter ruhlandii TaxID=72557 RepID=UPI002DC027B4